MKDGWIWPFVKETNAVNGSAFQTETQSRGHTNSSQVKQNMGTENYSDFFLGSIDQSQRYHKKQNL